MKGQIFCWIAILLFALASAKERYDGHQVWRLHINSKEIAEVANVVFEKFRVDVWDVSRDHIDIRVNPDFELMLDIALKALNIKHDVMIQDIQKLIDKEGQNRVPNSRAFDFSVYHPFDEIEAYLAEVDANSSLATLSSIGTTYEGRTQHQMIFSTGAGKPSMWIDCGIHAREWITPATCLYGVDLLTTQYGIDPDVTTLLDTYDIYMVPVYNPDGYDFTWTDTRMWRKNRMDYADPSGCVGVDLNRNFDDHWAVVGSSSDPCESTYHGPSAASEIETQNSQNKILDLIDNNGLTMIFTIHSYSQYWMYAYGWTGDLPPDWQELDQTSQVGVDALTAVYGTPYEYGTLYNVLYPAAGTTVDYGYGQGISHTYLLELRDTGEYGFLLPEEQIIPTAEETWAGLIAAMLYV